MLSERVATHFTGRRSVLEAHITSASSGNAPPFRPKPPPTSGATTRTWFSFTWKMCAISMRTPCGFCDEV